MLLFTVASGGNTHVDRTRRADSILPIASVRFALLLQRLVSGPLRSSPSPGLSCRPVSLARPCAIAPPCVSISRCASGEFRPPSAALRAPFPSVEALDDVLSCLWPTLVARPTASCARAAVFLPRSWSKRLVRCVVAASACLSCPVSSLALQLRARLRLNLAPAQWRVSPTSAALRPRVPRRALDDASSCLVGQLLSRGHGLMREGPPFFCRSWFERLCAVRGFRPA